MTQRISWLDTFRGMLILLVVLNHQSIFHTQINDALSSIRMPAFFFISGFVLSNRYTDFTYFSQRRFRQLIVPYFIFYLLNYIFWAIVLAGPEADIKQPLFEMLFGCVNTPEGSPNMTAGPLWFITTLFMAEIYMFFIKNYFQQSKPIFFVLILSAGFGYALSVFMPFRLPWNMDVAFSAVLFYGLGYLVKKEQLIDRLISKKLTINILIFLVTISIGLVFGFHNNTAYTDNYLGDNILFTYISAFSGVIALMTLAKIINKNIILEFLGQNTYVILAFHLSILYILQGLVKRTGIIDFASTQNSDVWGLFYMVISIIILIPIIFLLDKYAPFILNRRK